MGRTTDTRVVRSLERDSLDFMLFEGMNSYREIAPDTQLRWIREAVTHHLTYSQLYQRLAAAQKFTADELERPQDLLRVPLVSSGSFKRRALAASVSRPVKLCTSSGTSGTKSIVPRDSATLERYVGGVLHGIRNFLEDRERRRALVLGPPPHEVGDLWFTYSLSLAEVLNDTEYFVSGGRLDSPALYRALSTMEPGTQPVVIGPPSLLWDFLDWMTQQRRTLDLAARSAFLLTAGGWKLRADESVDRDTFNRRIGAQLGLPAERLRDLFNMVELNTVIFECERAHKHIPPWLHVSARRASDLEAVAEGETGILAYLDPTALSYPAFILSDDLGSVTQQTCACGRTGPVMTIARRLRSIEERGCGLRMRTYASQGTDSSQGTSR